MTIKYLPYSLPCEFTTRIVSQSVTSSRHQYLTQNGRILYCSRGVKKANLKRVLIDLYQHITRPSRKERRLDHSYSLVNSVSPSVLSKSLKREATLIKNFRTRWVMKPGPRKAQTTCLWMCWRVLLINEWVIFTLHEHKVLKRLPWILAGARVTVWFVCLRVSCCGLG